MSKETTRLLDKILEPPIFTIKGSDFIKQGKTSPPDFHPSPESKRTE